MKTERRVPNGVQVARVGLVFTRERLAVSVLVPALSTRRCRHDVVITISLWSCWRPTTKTSDNLSPLASSMSTVMVRETVSEDARLRMQASAVVHCRVPCRTLISHHIWISVSLPRGNSDLPSQTYRPPLADSTRQPTRFNTYCAPVALSRRCPTPTYDVISAGNALLEVTVALKMSTDVSRN